MSHLCRCTNCHQNLARLIHWLLLVLLHTFMLILRQWLKNSVVLYTLSFYKRISVTYCNTSHSNSYNVHSLSSPRMAVQADYCHVSLLALGDLSGVTAPIRKWITLHTFLEHTFNSNSFSTTSFVILSITACMFS